MLPTNASPTSPTGAPHGPHFVLGAASDSQPPPLRAVQLQIEEIISSSDHKDEVVQKFLQLTTQLTSANAVAYCGLQAGEPRIVAIDRNGMFHGAERKQQLRAWSAEATRAGTVQLNQIQGEAEIVVSLPVFLADGSREALHVALFVRRGQVEPRIVSLQLVATGISAWHDRMAQRRTEFEARTSSASVELLTACGEKETLAETHFELVTELQRMLGCTTVAVASRDRQRRFRISAISGMPGVDQKSALAADLADCASEAEARGALTVWPPLAVRDQHASRIHQHLVQNNGYQAILSIPLISQGETEGVLFLLGATSVLHAEATRNTLTALAPHVAGSLRLKRWADAGPFARIRRRWQRDGSRRKSSRAVLVATLLGALLLLAPVPHKLTCDCVVEPSVKRFATVPFDGILETSFVRPGDLVSANQVLARMDDRDLSFERSEATAARVQAMKEADVHLAKGRIAEAQIAQFRAAELQAKLKWIAYREKHLEVKSKIAGVVIEGDLEHAEGAPVRHGQVLFEVARVDSLKLKLAIPESDIAYAESAMSVDARLEGAPGKRFDATLATIHPRATAESGENAFQADAHLQQQDETLRPGMSGTAKIIAPNRPLGWIVFHRAYRALVDFIDW